MFPSLVKVQLVLGGYALQFETTLRQRDVIGEWVELADPRPSSILGYGQKWLGPTWANIDDNLIMRVTPSKTENTTEKRVTFDLEPFWIEITHILRD